MDLDCYHPGQCCCTSETGNCPCDSHYDCVEDVIGFTGRFCAHQPPYSTCYEYTADFCDDYSCKNGWGDCDGDGQCPAGNGKCGTDNCSFSNIPGSDITEDADCCYDSSNCPQGWYDEWGCCGGEYDNCGICGGDGSSCEYECILGDMNGDGIWNVLDLVALGNCILGNSCGSDPIKACAADINGDGNYNVLDFVQLGNCVLADNCADIEGNGGNSDPLRHQPPVEMSKVEQNRILEEVLAIATQPQAIADPNNKAVQKEIVDYLNSEVPHLK